MEVKEESEKVGLKLNIQKTKIMASSLITSWQIDGETMETVTDFIFWGSKSTADGDCSHEIKRHLLFGRKAMTNLDRILPHKLRCSPLLNDTWQPGWEGVWGRMDTCICMAESLCLPVETITLFISYILV